MTAAESVLAVLSITNILLGALAFVTFKVLYQIVHYHFFHPLSKFPGPFWAGVTRLWLAWQDLSSTELASEYDLHKKHGKISLPRFISLQFNLCLHNPKSIITDSRGNIRTRHTYLTNLTSRQRCTETARHLPPTRRQDKPLHHR